MLKYLSVQVNLEVSNVGGDAGIYLGGGVDDAIDDTDEDGSDDDDEGECDFNKDAGSVLRNTKHNGDYANDGVRKVVKLLQSP